MRNSLWAKRTSPIIAMQWRSVRLIFGIVASVAEEVSLLLPVIEDGITNSV